MTLDASSPQRMPVDQATGQTLATPPPWISIRSRPFQRQHEIGTAEVWSVRGRGFRELTINLDACQLEDDDARVAHQLSTAIGELIDPDEMYCVRINATHQGMYDTPRVAALPVILSLLKHGATLSKNIEDAIREPLRDPVARIEFARLATKLVAPNLNNVKLFRTAIHVAERVTDLTSQDSPLFAILNLEIPVTVHVAGFPTTRVVPFGYVYARRFLNSPAADPLFNQRAALSPIMIFPGAKPSLADISTPRNFDYSLGARLASRTLQSPIGMGMTAGFFACLVTSNATADSSFGSLLSRVAIGAAAGGIVADGVSQPFRRGAQSLRVARLCDTYKDTVERQGKEP